MECIEDLGLSGLACMKHCETGNHGVFKQSYNVIHHRGVLKSFVWFRSPLYVVESTLALRIQYVFLNFCV